MSLASIALIAAAFAAAAILTGAVRWYTLRSGLLDVPNARSLHARPTPRGGGIAIVLVCLAVGVVQTVRGALPFDLALALLVGGAAVALVGWLDDRYTLGNRIRMSIWIPTAVWAVYWVGGLPALDLGVAIIPLGIVGAGLAVIGVIWMLNLYNFMDGIDGLAGSQAVMAAGAAGALLLLGGHAGLATVPLILAAAAAGFLVWNWPPAKIFMGDVGSGFIGYVFAVLALYSENTGALPLVVWGLLLAVFLVDATFTVARRVKSREKWSEAHRSHAYQVAVQRGRPHRTVTLAIIGINALLIGAAALAWWIPALMVPIAALAILWLGTIWYSQVRHLRAVQQLEAQAAPAADGP